MRVSGPISPRRLSEDATAALACGDIDELLRLNREEFGGFVMVKKGDDDDDDGDGDDDDSGDSGAGDGDEEDDDSGDDSDTVSKAEYDRLKKMLSKADKRASALEKQRKEEEDAKKDELTKTTERVQELEKAVADAQTENSALRLQNAFLTANDHPWHDPDTALDLAARNGYLEDVVDDEGEIDKVALKKALDRLAKEKAFLVKTEKKDDDEPGDPSGEPAGGRSDNSKDERAKKEQLRKRFPVLSQR